MNKLVTGIPLETFRALPVIAAAYNLSSSNAVVLAALDAMINELCDRDPTVKAAIELARDDKELPGKVQAVT